MYTSFAHPYCTFSHLYFGVRVDDEGGRVLDRAVAGLGPDGDLRPPGKVVRHRPQRPRPQGQAVEQPENTEEVAYSDTGYSDTV